MIKQELHTFTKPGRLPGDLRQRPDGQAEKDRKGCIACQDTEAQPEDISARIECEID